MRSADGFRTDIRDGLSVLRSAAVDLNGGVGGERRVPPQARGRPACAGINLGSAHEPSSLVGPDELSFVEDAPSHDGEKFIFAQSNWCIQLGV